MADQNEKSYLIWRKCPTREFLGSLITNSRSTFRNSKWRMQYRCLKCKSYLIGMIFGTRMFRGRWLRPELKILKFKMVDPMWRNIMQKLLDWDEFWYPGVFGIAAYESAINIQKFKMVNPISLTKLSLKFFWFDALLSRKRFKKFWNMLLYLRNIYIK